MLREVLGSNNVYYQPPESVRLKYPCIVYSQKVPHVLHADNLPYQKTRCYKVMLITGDPDTELQDELEKLPLIRMVTDPYTSDNLHHFVYQLYY